MDNANAPAVPQIAAMIGPDGVEKVTVQYTGGLTKREEFAKAAMQGILAGKIRVEVLDYERAADRAYLASLSVAMGDAVLAVLEHSEKQPQSK